MIFHFSFFIFFVHFFFELKIDLEKKNSKFNFISDGVVDCLRSALDDASADVRLAATRVIKGNASFDALLLRTRDADVRVRRAAFQRLFGRKNALRALHMPQVI